MGIHKICFGAKMTKIRRDMHILFFLFVHENICCGYSLEVECLNNICCGYSFEVKCLNNICCGYSLEVPQ